MYVFVPLLLVLFQAPVAKRIIQGSQLLIVFHLQALFTQEDSLQAWVRRLGRWKFFRVHNRSGNSQTVELSLITFVRDVTNPSSLLTGFQQVEEMSVDGICVSLETRLGVDTLFSFC